MVRQTMSSCGSACPAPNMLAQVAWEARVRAEDVDPNSAVGFGYCARGATEILKPNLCAAIGVHGLFCSCCFAR